MKHMRRSVAYSRRGRERECGREREHGCGCGYVPPSELSERVRACFPRQSAFDVSHRRQGHHVHGQGSIAMLSSRVARLGVGISSWR